MRGLGWLVLAGILFSSSAWAGTLTNAAGPLGVAGGFYSTEGVPTNGFIPSAAVGPQGCLLQAAGGNMGTSALGGVNFLMSCDEQDNTGSWFQIVNNDNINQPKDIFSVRRDGYVNSNGMTIFQSNYFGNTFLDSYYLGWNMAKENNSSLHTYASSLAMTADVPNTSAPILGIMGLTNTSYAGSRPPIYQYYGSTWVNSALYNSTYGSKLDGTMLESLEDNGNKFSNQLLRTNAAYTNATTNLGMVTNLGAPIKSGRTYAFTAKLYVTSATGGIKLAINSSQAVTAVVYHAVCTHHAATPAITSSGAATALATAIAAASTSLASGALCIIEGTITPSAGGSTELNATATSASATMTMASTTGLVNNQLITQQGVGCDVVPANTFVASFVASTSVTMSNNAACSNSSIKYNFLDTVWVEAASNAAGTLTIARGSTFELKGSINGGAY